jgi:hypothetical protein
MAGAAQTMPGAGLQLNCTYARLGFAWPVLSMFQSYLARLDGMLY